MKYPGKELEIFDKARIFQKYIFFLIKKYLKKIFLKLARVLVASQDIILRAIKKFY